MIVLGIETSGRIGSVALCDEARALASHTFPEGARHAPARAARDIMPAVDGVFRDAGIAKDDVGAVAVSEGPGSFTGLRIGVTCAKTLAYALGWQAVGVPSMDVMVRNVEAAREGCPVACPVLDARRAKVYGTVFEWDGSEWRDTTGVLICEPPELAEAVPEGALVFGSGVRAYADVFAPPRFRVGDESLMVGRAEVTARLGLRRIRAGLQVDPMKLMPRYYRPTEPEEKLQAAGNA